MVSISRETGAQTEARLRRVFRASAIEWLPGSWSFVEGPDAAYREDAIALIRDDGRASALCPAGPGERFAVFRVVLPRGADDSGFVGWLSTRVKASTGSGLFVICGQNSERGGIFDFYGVPEAAAGEVRELLERLSRTEHLDGVVLHTVATGESSALGPGTVFCFDQTGDAITARYGGGGIAEGWLAGTLDGSRVRFQYLQVQADGTVDSGHSEGEVTRLPDGRWSLTEHYTWATRQGSGTTRLEEAAPPGDGRFPS
ncbi:hypothetical protein GCM10017786_11050 [Amycolatopsis deserti]|uniref:Uncharacterized protein n=1 Tax=Amycolatopsis deserti TaxID=185696 RepID=A0ABQ3II08_9PSEU|nr:DUF6196 family protein [Amycolatopsis deserti]GHE82120.1 hypothetical protein GCM10017786_11050 [Amycolatopsis deserti]